jgi:hypothetical protein
VAIKLGMQRRRAIENPVIGIDVDLWHLAAAGARR